MFTIHETSRKNWQWEVRFNGGQTIARCNYPHQATRIANSLNLDLEAREVGARHSGDMESRNKT